MKEKSTLKVEDISKMGTILDGVRLEAKKPVTLSNNEYQIKLGNWEHTLTLVHLIHFQVQSTKSIPESNGSRFHWLLRTCLRRM
jgi:hypothetical protein